MVLAEREGLEGAGIAKRSAVQLLCAYVHIFNLSPSAILQHLGTSVLSWALAASGGHRWRAAEARHATGHAQVH